MFDLLKSTLDELKKRVQFNTEILDKSEKKIQQLLKEPVSEKRTLKLNKRFDFNKKLLDETKDVLALQKRLMSFLEKYNPETEDADKVIITPQDRCDAPPLQISREEYLELTIDQMVEFNRAHPYFNDKDFVRELIVHYSEIEDYEMCAKITNVYKKSVSSRV